MGKRFSNGKIDPKRMVCAHCLHDNCSACVDVVRALFGMELICTCTRKGHSGEPRDSQVLDPDTGDVYGPGSVIRANGEVERL